MSGSTGVRRNTERKVSNNKPAHMGLKSCLCLQDERQMHAARRGVEIEAYSSVDNEQRVMFTEWAALFGILEDGDKDTYRSKYLALNPTSLPSPLHSSARMSQASQGYIRRSCGNSHLFARCMAGYLTCHIVFDDPTPQFQYLGRVRK